MGEGQTEHHKPRARRKVLARLFPREHLKDWRIFMKMAA